MYNIGDNFYFHRPGDYSNHGAIITIIGINKKKGFIMKWNNDEFVHTYTLDHLHLNSKNFIYDKIYNCPLFKLVMNV